MDLPLIPMELLQYDLITTAIAFEQRTSPPSIYIHGIRVLWLMHLRCMRVLVSQQWANSCAHALACACAPLVTSSC